MVFIKMMNKGNSQEGIKVNIEEDDVLSDCEQIQKQYIHLIFKKTQ